MKKKLVKYAAVAVIISSVGGLYAYSEHKAEEERRADALVKQCIGAYRFVKVDLYWRPV
ncbi:hypothetical protein PDPE_1-03159 [Photobacterium damselae subsp. piscicida]|uniref:hypothetical protein n=1 Tax=Photobacterium damselae TaxID=38293 RepID=UPI0002E5FA9F|nr:hypothetical protein [Photobacterium damselae]BBC42318.1 hypothetical protein PDPE_1-03159 [Photobacterium damselae subsp. piscicida]